MKTEAAAAPADRTSVLESRRVLKMARSAHAYVRGNTAKFYEWLSESRVAAALPAGPPVWICGDLHVGNLGPLAATDGRVEIQIRDLDQTVVGNPAHDLIRLALSLAMAARGSNLSGVTTAHMLEEMVEGYELALREPDAGDLTPEPDVVRTVRRRAVGRRWRQLARERIDDTSPFIPLGRQFWTLTDDERSAIRRLFETANVRRLVLSAVGKSDDTDVTLMDAAYWMKGCSSLGKLRYAVVVKCNGSKRRGELALVDLKEAVPALATAAPGANMPQDHAERVVAGARALSPNLGDRMAPVELLGRPVVARELAPAGPEAGDRAVHASRSGEVGALSRVCHRARSWSPDG